MSSNPFESTIKPATTKWKNISRHTVKVGVHINHIEWTTCTVMDEETGKLKQIPKTLPQSKLVVWEPGEIHELPVMCDACVVTEECSVCSDAHKRNCKDATHAKLRTGGQAPLFLQRVGEGAVNWPLAQLLLDAQKEEGEFEIKQRNKEIERRAIAKRLEDGGE